MRSLAADLRPEIRFAFRRLRKSPGFTAVALLSLTLGIGATTAIFSVVRTMLFRPLGGLVEPERLVEIGRTRDGSGFDTLSYPDFRDYRAEAKSFSALYAWELAPLHVRADGEARRAAGMLVTPGFFETLGVRPAYGRFFHGDEEKPGNAAVAVASHAFWRARLGADPAAVGRTIRVNDSDVTLVGVAEESFRGQIVALAPDLYLPLGALAQAVPLRGNEIFEERRSMWLLAGGRLAPGVSLLAAQAELQAIAARIQKEAPAEFGEIGVELAPLGPMPAMANGPLGLFGTLLFVLVGLVLLVACSNVAGMTLARTEARSREIAVRQALGAPTSSIARQLLVESVLLFSLAAPPAVAVAAWGTSLLGRLRPPAPYPIRVDFPLDWTVLAFALVVGLATGVLFGLAPAFQAARRETTPALRDAAPVGLRRLLGRKTLVAAQLAFSLVLLTASGLLLRALGRASSIDVGFDPKGVETFSVDLGLAGYPEAELGNAQVELVERIARIPTVEHVSFAAVLPMNFDVMGMGGVVPERPAAGAEVPERGHDADVNIVTAGFFATLGVPVRGRVFDARDAHAAPRVAVITESMGRMLFGDRDPLGEAFVIDPRGEKLRTEVVGVVRDGRYRSLGAEPDPTYFIPTTQFARGYGHVLLEARGDRAARARALAAEIAAFDPDLPRPELRTLEAVAANSTLPQRIAVSVAGSLGTLGVGLAALGLYGLLAYAVARRGKEIAVRTALGAQSAEIVRLVVRDAAKPVAIGVALGLAGATALAFTLGSLLYGLPPIDPVAFAGSAALLAAVAAVAALIPARRALRVSPASALRSE